MPIDFKEREQPDVLGNECYALVARLYPLCRSITGDGLRSTFKILSESISLTQTEVPSGTRVFDWTVPCEWNIRDAYIETPNGKKIARFSDNNLHVVNYSIPQDKTLSLEDLQPHLHSLPEHPDWIPYRTTYYNPDWGFCISENQRKQLNAGEYHVVIDSTLENGSLTYAESYIKGQRDEEILFFAHTCHPSLCNDNLSGVSIAWALSRILANYPLKYSYRFLFAPATIGSISWLSKNRSMLDRIKAGLVISVCGDCGNLHYKKSRTENAYIDRVVQHTLESSGRPHSILPFSPWGYDERQFASPGINLPVGRLTRTPNGEYPEYHSSADDLSLVQPEFLGDTLDCYLEIIETIENDAIYQNLAPFGEPQLGKRGLYNKMGGFQNVKQSTLAMLWLLNQSDGTQSLLDISQRSGIRFSILADTARILMSQDLLKLKGDTLL